jgi:hypothetical protein
VHEVTEVDWQDTEIQEKKNPRKKKNKPQKVPALVSLP